MSPLQEPWCGHPITTFYALARMICSLVNASCSTTGVSRLVPLLFLVARSSSRCKRHASRQRVQRQPLEYWLAEG